MKIKDIVESLQKRDQEEIVAYDMWCVEDVEYRAKDIGVPVTKEQCEGVLEAMEARFDANCGFSWYIMDIYIYELQG